MYQAIAWIVAGIPSVLTAAVSAWQLINGGSAWWLAGFVLAALLVPEANTMRGKE